jgi:hypothetical protein
MGATMDKKSIIFGEQHQVALQAFSDSKFSDIVHAIEDRVGKVAVDLGPAKAAVKRAQGNKKMKETAYVKVGVVKGNLVLRCKEKKFLGDIEEDGLLLKNWKDLVVKYDKVKKQEEQEKKAKEERVERLAKVLHEERDDGESIAERIKRGAQKANKLGLTPESQERMKKRGLKPMQQQYHGEVLDHQKNRYGGYLEYLRKEWEQHASKTHNFSQWLDEVEKNDTSVPGVREGRQILDMNLGHGGAKVKDVSGQVTYLDDKTRVEYACTVSKGTISGKKISGTGEFIFVIGPDSKIYAGSKARAGEGKAGAFNHSSFFSGGAVKSAGTITVQGGRIVRVTNVSGHYAPDESMIRLACTRFSSGDRECLRNIEVIIGGNQPTSAYAFLGLETEEEKNQANVQKQLQELTNLSHGKLERVDAEWILGSFGSGAWLIRIGSTGELVASYEHGGKFQHSLAKDFAALGLTMGKAVPKGSKGDPKTEPRVLALKTHAAYQGAMNSEAANKVLEAKPVGTWLLREGKTGICISVKQAKKYLHSIVGEHVTYEDLEKMYLKGRTDKMLSK